MRRNELRELGYLDFMSMQEKGNLITRANELKDDLQLMTMLSKRMSNSGFDFTLIPFQGMCKKFYNKLYMEYYQYTQDEFDIMLTEYAVVNHLFEVIDSPVQGIDPMVLRNVYTYFQDNFSMDIRDYVGDFIGCSTSCTAAKDIITKAIW